MDDGVRGADREDEGGQEVYTDGESDEITDRDVHYDSDGCFGLLSSVSSDCAESHHFA